MTEQSLVELARSIGLARDCPEAVGERLTGGELLQLLQEPLKKAAASSPSLQYCKDICKEFPARYVSRDLISHTMSPAPKHAVSALRKALPEINSYWEQVKKNLTSLQDHGSTDFAEVAIMTIDLRLQAVKKAYEVLNELDGLLADIEDWHFDWKTPSLKAATIFCRVAKDHGGKPFGISSTGPLVNFVRSSLDFQKWPIRHVTPDAVFRHLDRYQSAWVNHGMLKPRQPKY